MKLSNKVNQHFVPQYYLKFFSIKSNNKNIGTYVVKEDKFISSTLIKTQASGKYFYGEDGIFEDLLGQFEANQSPLINSILSKSCVKSNIEHNSIVRLFSLMHLRNPIIGKRFKQTLSYLKIADVYRKTPYLTAEKHAIFLSFKFLEQLTELLSDLEWKVFYNNTDIPFITSDIPVSRYNLYLEDFCKDYSTIAYGSSGLKMFLPISPYMCLILYDSDIYEVGMEDDVYVELNKTEDINQINLLQVLTSENNIFFDHQISESYLTELLCKSKEFNRFETSPILEKGVLYTERSLKLNLEISSLKLKGKFEIIGDDMPLRANYGDFKKSTNI